MTLSMNYWQLGSFCLTLLTLPYWPKIPGIFWCGPIVIYYLTIIIIAPTSRILGSVVGVTTALLLIIVFCNRMQLQSETLYQFGQNIIINVKVNSSFQQNSYGFSGIAQVTHINQSSIPKYLQPKVKLYTPILLQSGDTAYFSVKLKPIYGQRNEAGIDSERYYFSQGVMAKAFVVKDSDYFCVHQRDLRGLLQARVHDMLQNAKQRSVIMALAFADRSEISSQQWQWFKSSGLSHLMAISGLHISMAFSAGLFFTALIMRLIPVGNSAYLYWLPGIVGLLCAFGYSWLAEFTLPTQRALTMLVVSFALQSINLRISTPHRMLLVLAVVITINPSGPVTASFWLSFIAVTCVTYVTSTPKRPSDNIAQLKQWLMPHLVLSFLMTPLVAWLFGGVSLVAPLYNMLFIPWFSFIVIPLLFISLFLTGIEISTASLLWYWVDKSLSPLEWLLPFSLIGWQVVPLKWVALCTMSLCLYLARHWLSWRWSALAMVLCVIGLESKNKDGWRLDVLDVGLGLAVLIEKDGDYLLYDTGPSWVSGSSAELVITPLLEKRGARYLDTLIFSHLDNDHAGGRSEIEERWKPVNRYASQYLPDYRPCKAGEQWDWNGLHVKVLWPPITSHIKSNQLSCVVKISDPKSGYTVLLPGDIEMQAEFLMLNQQPNLNANIALVPHHGSKTSSSQRFVESVQPQWAIASLAKGNRWRFPDARVKGRYTALGAQWLDTGDLGQITFHFSRDNVLLRTMRGGDYPFHYVPWYRQMLRKQVE